MVGLAPTWVRLAPNVTNSGLFQIRFQYIWLDRAKCTEIWSEKVPDLSHLGPIWSILGPNLVTQQRTLSSQTQICDGSLDFKKRFLLTQARQTENRAENEHWSCWFLQLVRRRRQEVQHSRPHELGGSNFNTIWHALARVDFREEDFSTSDCKLQNKHSVDFHFQHFIWLCPTWNAPYKHLTCCCISCFYQKV